jgi:hypothetical protein
VPEGLSAVEVGKEIAEHREHTAGEHAPAEPGQRDRWIVINEAVLLSVVALLAAWSGCSAAKASLDLIRAKRCRDQPAPEQRFRISAARTLLSSASHGVEVSPADDRA